MRHELYGPFVPGEGPFRVKGVVYQGLVASFDARVPGGSVGVFSSLDDPDTKRFFETRFLAGSTYDFLPLLEASMAAARIAGQSWREFVRGGARLQAERDMKGVYRMFLKLASPSLVVERLPRILMQYFAFGRVSGELAKPGRYEARIEGIPKPVSPWLGAAAEGFMPFVMATAGAKDLRFVIHPSSSSGDVRGMELVTTRFAIIWGGASSSD